MVNPVPGRSVTTPFRKQSTGSWKTCGWHTGQDYAAPAGTPVVAARAGRLQRVDYGSGVFGTKQVAVFCSDGTRDFYAHMSRITGPVPRQVAAGEQIGQVGSEGNATGPHLHFERHLDADQPWNCGNMADPMLSHNAGGGSASPWAAGDVYRSKLRYGQRDSDSVRRLQYRLRELGIDPTIPTTGNYLNQTDAAVRKWQGSIKNTVDPAGRSYLGPKQTARMFSTPPYRVLA